ncbi:Penicillin binding transpeptidase domain protein [uncultured delta proteobacterium]|uniref:Penicillin binding transpeptidase domain protein n=1 Tax=uncultured delta proteobacterium TaxID=34034 RepID=A0A212JHK9_9DELT|nr:Penicillin binding transpeptidase domain protein [uncultured delta proteobacterium]
MARIKPTVALRNERAGRNKRKRPAAPAPRAKKPLFPSVNWGKVRLWGVGLVFAGLWILLWGRAYQVQIIRGPRYAEEARRAHVATEVATGRRGSIVDRNGNVLAKSVDVSSVAVRPGNVTDPDGATKLLSSALGIPAPKARKIVTDQKRGFVWVERKVNPRVAEVIRKADVPGVSLVREYERAYPFKHLAGQLLGFVNVDEKGIEGLELAFNDHLSGQQKSRVVQRDAAGRRLHSAATGEMEDLTGENLTLTIDTQVQFFAESALSSGIGAFGARWAACMVVDVPSGDILAWAEYPFFNPNRPAEANLFTRRNKTAMDALEQGSTIKPFLMAAALQEKVITPDSQYDCEKGKWKLRNVVIRDTSPHGTLTARDILKVSSNIGSAKIGMALGAAKYYGYLQRLGFGVRTGLPLAGENKGIVRPAKQWVDIDLATASFGQSFSATIVQMAQAYLCLANDGVKKNLRLVIPNNGSNTGPNNAAANGSGNDGKAGQTAEPERIFSVEVMRQVREMLRSAVEDTGGTGRRAHIDGLVVGGKTGTAQKASGDAYGAGRVASFVGMVPVEEPRYLVIVLLDEPEKNQYGGFVAAPIFKNVALHTMAYHGLLPESTPAQALIEFEREKKALAAEAAAAENTPALAAVVPEAARSHTDKTKPGQTKPDQTKPGAAKPGQAKPGQAKPGPAKAEPAKAEPAKPELVNAVQADGQDNIVPAVVGLSVRKAVENFARKGIVPEIKGEGAVVIRQTPEAGHPLPGAGGKFTIWLGDNS